MARFRILLRPAGRSDPLGRGSAREEFSFANVQPLCVDHEIVARVANVDAPDRALAEAAE